MDRDPLTVVNAYLAACDAFDFERARTFLADRGFTYRSPISRFESADDFVAYLSLVSGIRRSTTTRRVLVDGTDVCHFQSMLIQISEKLTVELVHWARVEEGKIAHIEAVFDASVYRDLFPAES